MGSNRGKRIENCREAIKRLSKKEGVSVERLSPLYETEPVGYLDQEPFINGVVEILTSLSPRELLKALLQIEKGMGRKRGTRWRPRVIDLDILIYDDLVLKEDDLIIPHPRMHERRFVLKPLSDIFPDFCHPELNRGIGELIGLLGNEQRVERIEESIETER